MNQLAAQPRDEKTKAQALRHQGFIPVILYGPKTESRPLRVAERDFTEVYGQAGENSLVNLQTGGDTYPVLIHEVQRDPLSGRVLHADLYQPPLDEKIEVAVPLVFMGEAPAVRELGGTLLKNLYEVAVRALPQDLPHEIVVAVDGLLTFEDRISVSDLRVPDGVEIALDSEDTVAQAVPAQDVEAELSQPAQEKVQEVETAEKKERGEAREASGEEEA